MGRFAAALHAVITGGCFVTVDYSGTEFRCSDGMTCPAGLVCIDNICRDPDFVPPDAAVDAPPGVEPRALIGDAITYTFDPVADLGNLVIDGSGNRLHGHKNAALVAGRFGQAVSFDSTAGTRHEVHVPTQAELFAGNTLTIEMWVFRAMPGFSMPLFGDLRATGTPPVTYQLDIGADDKLSFTTNSGCPSEATTIAGESATVTADQWVHVAVTWDGAEVGFYIDGARTDTVPLAITPCSSLSDNWLIGARDDDLLRFDGIIDEVKVSSYAKTDAEIAASMSHDSTAINGQCGNGVVSAGQSCEVGGLCCDDACAPLADDQPCASGSPDTCEAGVCAVGAGRTADGLIALYLFDEGAGVTVGDSSEVGTPVNLTIADETLVTWGLSSLTISQTVAITSGTAATKIIDRARASDELSVEAWLTPADTTQSGPARIVSLSTDTARRNFTLGQRATSFSGRIRSTSTTGNGTPPAYTSGIARTALTHVVITSAGDGTRRMYVDGRLTGVTRSSGVFANWDATMLLSVGDEITANRLWTGELHLIAIYDRELTGSEVAGNFVAGPD